MAAIARSVGVDIGIGPWDGGRERRGQPPAVRRRERQHQSEQRKLGEKQLSIGRRRGTAEIPAPTIIWLLTRPVAAMTRTQIVLDAREFDRGSAPRQFESARLVRGHDVVRSDQEGADRADPDRRCNQVQDVADPGARSLRRLRSRRRGRTRPDSRRPPSLAAASTAAEVVGQVDHPDRDPSASSSAALR